jgi:hypothetical protein
MDNGDRMEALKKCDKGAGSGAAVTILILTLFASGEPIWESRSKKGRLVKNQ